MPLPPGIVLTTATVSGTTVAVLSGTPTAAGLYFYTVQITDSNGATGIVSCSFQTAPGPAPVPAFGNASGCYFKHWETRYEARNEPAKVNYYRSDIKSLEENIIEAFDVDINPNGTATATVYIDNVIVQTNTITGTKRQSYTFAVTTNWPHATYGRTLYVSYTGTGVKMYNTWFHERPEPDRWESFVSKWDGEEEREIKVFLPEINCLGNAVIAECQFTVGNSGTDTYVATYTITGNTRVEYTFSLPIELYARMARVSYQAGTIGTNGTFTSGGVRFKHYATKFDGPKEPPRVTLLRQGPYDFPSNHFIKTWQVELDCLTGTVTGTLKAEDVILTTASFTGNRRQWYTVGVDLGTYGEYVLNTASRWEAVFMCNNSSQFKLYDHKMESDEEPFRKVSWSFHYRKIGGATQIDLARYWSAFTDVEDTSGPIVATYWWDIDGQNFNTGTLTLASDHEFTDRIAFPPGARGRLFEFRLLAPATVKIHNVNVDLAEEGIKNLTRRGKQGTPKDNTD